MENIPIGMCSSVDLRLEINQLQTRMPGKIISLKLDREFIFVVLTVVL